MRCLPLDCGIEGILCYDSIDVVLFGVQYVAGFIPINDLKSSRVQEYSKTMYFSRLQFPQWFTIRFPEQLKEGISSYNLSAGLDWLSISTCRRVSPLLSPKRKSIQFFPSAFQRVLLSDSAFRIRSHCSKEYGSMGNGS